MSIITTGAGYSLLNGRLITTGAGYSLLHRDPDRLRSSGTINIGGDSMDDIRVTDDRTGTKYIFRGSQMYKVVDGKEVLVKPKDGGKDARRNKDTGDRPGK